MRRTSLDEAITAGYIHAPHGGPAGPPRPVVLSLSEIAQLEGVIKLQQSALAQHQSAVRHWLAVGDQGRADAAVWREDYVTGLLARLRIDLDAVRDETPETTKAP